MSQDISAGLILHIGQASKLGGDIVAEGVEHFTLSAFAKLLAYEHPKAVVDRLAKLAARFTAKVREEVALVAWTFCHERGMIQEA